MAVYKIIKIYNLFLRINAWLLRMLLDKYAGSCKEQIYVSKARGCKKA